jgi:hypothetical protein
VLLHEQAPVDWVDLNEKLLHRQWKCGRHASGPLEPGPSGFAVARIEGSEVTTEVPNLLLQCAKKRPAATVQKKPALLAGEQAEEEAEELMEESEQANEEEEQEEEEEAEEKQDEAPPEGLPQAFAQLEIVKRYGTMYYKNTHCIGIRQKFYSKSQIICFGGKSCAKTVDELRAIGQQVIAKLEAGEMSEAEGKAWAKAQASA